MGFGVSPYGGGMILNNPPKPASRQSALRSILLIAKYPPASLPLLLPTKFRLMPHSAGALCAPRPTPFGFFVSRKPVRVFGTHKCVPYKTVIARMFMGVWFFVGDDAHIVPQVLRHPPQFRRERIHPFRWVWFLGSRWSDAK